MRLTRRSPISGLAEGQRIGIRREHARIGMWAVADAGTHERCLCLGGAGTTRPSKRALSSGRALRWPEWTVGADALIPVILHPAARSPYDARRGGTVPRQITALP